MANTRSRGGGPIEIWGEIIALTVAMECVLVRLAAEAPDFDAFLRDEHERATEHLSRKSFDDPSSGAAIAEHAQTTLDGLYTRMRRVEG